MNIEIFLFGIAREIVGNQKLSFELPEGATVKTCRELLYQKYPDFARLNSMMIAVNEDYAEDEQVINPKDEIALIPPVSGG